MKREKLTFLLAGLVIGVFIVNPTKALGDSIKHVLVTNFPANQDVTITNEEPIPVEVSNLGEEETQLWDYWYQCHPNPTNEAEIRSYLNDRGDQGWEVIAAAGPGGLICEYYKRPR